MNESELRTEYWVDTRSHPEFPLWVIFKRIGHQQGVVNGVPYLRESKKEIPDVLKALERHQELPLWAKDLGMSEAELRSVLWYVTWLSESKAPPPEWEDWNRRVDEAWTRNLLAESGTDS